MRVKIGKAIDLTGKLLIVSASAAFVSHATLSPAFAEYPMMGPAKGRFAQQIPTPRCDGFEDYMRDAGEFVVDGVEYLGEKTIKSTIGMGKLLAGNPNALIDEIDGTFNDLGTAAATLSRYTPLALISVIVDELPPGGFTDFLKSGVKFQDQLREGVAMGLAQNLNPLKQARTIYSDGSEVFGDIGKVLVNLDDPLAAGNEFLKLNQKWTGAGALTYMLTEKDPMTGLKKALNAMHRQVELVSNHAGPNGKVASAVLDYAMGESKKLINQIPDPKTKQVAALLAATFATTFKQTLKDPNYKRNGYNVSRHPFYFADIRKIPAEWMGNDHNSGGDIDWGMDRARVEDHHGCISLGDYAYNNGTVKNTTAVCGVENGRNKWWSRPIDYKLVWGDNCSGGTHDRSVWQPVCQDGYISVGFVAGRGSWKKPKPNRIACVKNDPHLFNVVDGLKAKLLFTANDKGSGAKFDITTYSRNLDGLWLTHAVPVARDKGDKRFVQSLRVAVRVPGIPPSGEKSNCVNFYADRNYHGRTTQLCANKSAVAPLQSMGGPWGATHKNVSSIQCGAGVAGLLLYRHKLDGSPKRVPCHDYELNSRTKGAYSQYTHAQLMTSYLDPSNNGVVHWSPEEQLRRADLKASCDKSNTNSCVELGSRSLVKGWEKSKDAANIVNWYGRACKEKVQETWSCQGYVKYARQFCQAAQTTKACSLSHGADRWLKLELTRQDLSKKRAACQAGSSQECFDFANDLFSVGKARSAEWSEGLAVYQKLCDTNFSDSCQQLKALAGNMCIGEMGKGCTITGHFRIKDAPKGYEAPNRKSAIKDYEKGCNLGDEEGCQEFSRLRVQDAYSDPISSKNRLAALQGANPATPDGTQPKTPTSNRAKDSAVQTLFDSCQRGNQRSCEMHAGYLGELNFEKQGDYFKCVRLGEAKSCTAYGKAVEGAEKGTITKNPVSTKDGSSDYFYKEACNGVYVSGATTKGDGEACMILGNKTLIGEDGTPANQREANSIGNFVLACETLGHAESCLIAAKVIVGPTMPQSQKHYAAIYEKKACELGSQVACDLLFERTMNLNNAGQKSGDSRTTSESCALRTTSNDFDASSQLDIEPTKLKVKFSNSGTSPLILKYRVNMSTESEWTTILPGETIDIEDYKNRTYVLLDVNQQCVGAAKLISDNLRFSYAADESIVSNNDPNANKSANPTAGKTTATNNTPTKTQPNSGVKQVTLDAAQNCNLRGTLVSNNANVAATVEFENTGSEQLFVYWLDENGSDTDYNRTGNPLAIVAAGATETINSGVGLAYSVFSVVDGQTYCVGVTSIEKSKTHVKINGDAGNASSNKTASTPGDSGAQDSNQSANSSGVQQLGSCSQIGRLVSASTGQDAEMSLTNTGAGDLYIYWIDQNGEQGDYDGGNKPVMLVSSGQTVSLDAEIGDAYSVLDVDSNCIGVTPQLGAKSRFSAAAANDNNKVNNSQPADIAQQSTNDSKIQQKKSNQSALKEQLEMAAGNRCELRGSIVSELSGQEGTVSFANNGSTLVYVYWLDETGADTDYDYSGNPLAALGPGDAQSFETKAGFAYSAFALVNDQSVCAGVTQLANANALVSINADGVGDANANDQTFAQDQSQSSQQDQPNDQTDQNDGLDESNDQDDYGPSQISLHSGTGCEMRGQVDSSGSGEQAEVIFSNVGSDTVYVYWVDENGEENDYDYSGNPVASIEPGDVQSFESRIGFIYSAFSVVNDAPVCIGMTEVEAPTVSININGG